MHPMERLRAVARSEGAGPGLLVREAAAALAGLGSEPAGIVTACRRLVERHPTVGPMWWLASRVLCAADPVAEAWLVADELEADATVAHLVATLPDDATVVLVGWPEQAVDAVRRRGDVSVRLVSSGGESSGLAPRLRRAGVEVDEVADAGVGAAAAAADLVVLEAVALGPARFVATAGSRAAAAVAATCGVPVWLVAGAGRALPEPLWAAVERRFEGGPEAPWERPEELVGVGLCQVVVGEHGRGAPSAAPRPAWGVAPELLAGPG
jgi:hypothetical protein